MGTSLIIDQYGRPIKKQELLTEQAAPMLSGVRSVWSDSIASGLTPPKLAALLKSAGSGDPNDYLILAEEMEEKDPHYASVLGTRKRALTGLDIVVSAASEETHDKDIASAVEVLVEAPAFRDCLDDLMDGLGKGYSVSEIMWEFDANEWRIPEYRWRDPRFFQVDKLTGRTLRLRDEDEKDGIELQPYRFICHVPKLKSGLAVRGGLARLCAWPFIFKSYTLKDWVAFVEVFGFPFRVGKYGPLATDEDKRILLRAVANIATDAAAVIPRTMELEFITAPQGRGDAVFGKLAEYLDKQVSKAVLGQTMTTDDGSSQAQAKVHDEVRRDVLEADARQLANTLNRDLVRPFVDLNFGPQERYPRIELPVTESEDLTALAGNLSKLVPLGLKVQMSDVRDRFGLPDPDDDAELLGVPASEPDGDAKSETATARVQKHHSACCPCCGDPVTAIARSGGAQDRDEMDALTDEALDDWEAQIDPMLAPIRKLLDEVGSFDELIKRLPEALPDMDEDELVRILGSATFKARGRGDARDE